MRRSFEIYPALQSSADLVERRNPIPFSELARETIIQNGFGFELNGSLTNSIEKNEELQLTAMEKEELKKLVRCNRPIFHWSNLFQF